MAKKFYKHSDDDKWDAYMPNKSWLQDNYDASRYMSMFHSSKAYGYNPYGNRKGFTLGSQKKMIKASSHGICLDSSSGWIGKSDAN